MKFYITSNSSHCNKKLHKMSTFYMVGKCVPCHCIKEYWRVWQYCWMHLKRFTLTLQPLSTLWEERPMCFIAHQPFLEQPLGYNINVVSGILIFGKRAFCRNIKSTFSGTPWCRYFIENSWSLGKTMQLLKFHKDLGHMASFLIEGD